MTIERRWTRCAPIWASRRWSPMRISITVKELGYLVLIIPRNADADHYCGWCCFGCKDGRKKATSETWLVDMAECGNNVILPGCSAVRVLQWRRPGRRRPAAAGVLVRFDEEMTAGEEGTYVVVEAKVTVVACGALRTPELHLHSVVMAWGYFPVLNLHVLLIEDPPLQQRALAADTISYKAYWRVRDPVYGCVGIISLLLQEIQISQRELAKMQALLAMHAAAEGGGPRGELAAERTSASTAVARYQLQGLHAWDPQDCTLLAADLGCQIPPSLPPSSCT